MPELSISVLISQSWKDKSATRIEWIRQIIRVFDGCLDRYIAKMFALIAAEVQSCQPVWGQNVISGGQLKAVQWYDIGAESIQNM